MTMHDVEDKIGTEIEKRVKARKRKRGPYRKSSPLPY
jgi:hypothetical protein